MTPHRGGKIQNGRKNTLNIRPYIVESLNYLRTLGLFRLSLGYRLARRFWNKGYATEACKAIISWLVELFSYEWFVMEKEYYIPPSCLDDIRSFAEKENLPDVIRIVSKHNNGEISLTPMEVNIVVDIAMLWRLQAELKYPYWDVNHPNYNPEHERKFLSEQEERWGKIAMTFGAELDLEIAC
ncbi:GNAT family N-acetyltransferase [Hahella ganghwensis]|uniref:GNAT family N-acetyltransferase n=1 Tax=Hahella ganghwensis TaxID=286420 RepID=UPI0003677FAA|nr:GNAT family N-acetyltransferase [Hahella ganghwensis]